MAGWFSRWKPKHLLGAWVIYWLGLATSVLWRPVWLFLGFEADHGTASVSGGLTNLDLGVTLTLNDAQVWSLTAPAWEWTFWLVGPPLLLWALWLKARPSRRALGDRSANAALKEGTGAAEPLLQSRDRAER